MASKIRFVYLLNYYLLVVKAAYLQEPAEELIDLMVSPSIRMLAGVLISVMVIAGIYPRHFIELAKAAAMVLM